MAADHFWRGPVRTESRARSITNVVGWVFIGVAALNLYGAIRPAVDATSTGLVGALVTVLLFGLPSAFLLKDRSRAAAVFLFILNVLCLAGGVVLLVLLAMPTQAEAFPLALAATVLVFWLLLTWLSWRAVVATRALRRLRAEAIPAEF